jgi:enoyl-CoA hydratase
MFDQMRHIRYLEKGGVATITIDRPGARNALAAQTMRELAEALDLVRRSENRVLVIRGAGDQAFCAGGDLKELEMLRSKPDAVEMARTMRATLDGIPALPIPVIAALNGDALGGGAELAVACDFRIAARRARIGFTQIRLGLVPAWGASERLASLVGRGRALYMLTSGHNMTAAGAMALGLIEEVIPDEEFDERVETQAAAIAGAPRQALAGIKASVGAILPHRHPEHAETTIDAFAETWTDPAHWAAVDKMDRQRRARKR